MTMRVYQTTVITNDGLAALDMVSIPRDTMPAASQTPLELMLGVPLTQWQPMDSLIGDVLDPPSNYNFGSYVGVFLTDVFSSTMSPGHLNEIAQAMHEVPLIPVERSDPTLQTLAGLGGAGAAAGALLYGVTVMGPIAVVAVPAGVFLWYVAKPAGEGVGGWIKRKLIGEEPRE